MRNNIFFGFGVASFFLLVACGGDEDERSGLPGSVADETASVATGTEETGTGAGDASPEASPTRAGARDESSAGGDSEFLASLDGFIVFSSERDDEADGTRDDLYIMNVDGSDVRRLTATERTVWWPELSPDGHVLVFGRNYADRHGSPSGRASWGVFVQAAGSEPVDLTDNHSFQAGARWSPDGSRLLYTFEDQVAVIDADGSSRRSLLTNDGGQTAAWSPDGRQIVFGEVAERDEGADLFIMDADGTNLRRLTEGVGFASRPDWSPDGARIVFDSDHDGEPTVDSDIFVIDVDGSNLEQITDNDALDSFAKWSPDGGAIVFKSDRDGNSEIYVMAADGSNQTNISNNGAFDAYPSWSAVPFE